MKILVTGHKGFVGKHFISKLDNERNQIVGIDIKEGNDCRDFFRKDINSKFDLVIHLAAIVGGRETIENDPIAVATDLSIDSEMFNWAVRTKPKKIVYFSSSAAYPIELQTNGVKHLLKESDINLENIKSPDFTYGWAKLSGEILASHARGYGLDVIVFRPFSGYGEDQDLTYPFPAFIDRIKQKHNPFVIWGNGEQVRDFIHINDIVDCVMLAVKEGIPGPINLGSGVPTSFNQLAREMFGLAHFTPGIRHLTQKPVGVSFRCCDNTKMLSFYKPKVSLEDGIKRALEYNRG